MSSDPSTIRVSFGGNLGPEMAKGAFSGIQIPSTYGSRRTQNCQLKPRNKRPYKNKQFWKDPRNQWKTHVLVEQAFFGVSVLCWRPIPQNWSTHHPRCGAKIRIIQGIQGAWDHSKQNEQWKQTWRQTGWIFGWFPLGFFKFILALGEHSVKHIWKKLRNIFPKNGWKNTWILHNPWIKPSTIHIIFPSIFLDWKITFPHRIAALSCEILPNYGVQTEECPQIIEKNQVNVGEVCLISPSSEMLDHFEIS